MIYNTLFNVIDNTGIKTLLCIGKINSNKNIFNIGDIIIGIVKKVLSNSSIKISSIHKALIVQIKKNINKKNGMYFKYKNNSVIILNKLNIPLGTRIFDTISIKSNILNKLKPITKNIL